MPKIFRGVRKIQISKAKAGNYFLYALGEIILVVIGILIALQINEWQLDKEHKEIEDRTLRNIKKDLGENIKSLNDVLLFKTEQQVNCSELIDLFVDTSYPVADTVKMLNKLNRLSYFILPTANNTAFETAKNTGNLNYITNDSLLNLLTFYFSDITLDQHVTDTKRFTNQFVELVLMKNFLLYSKDIIALDGIGGEYRIEEYEKDTRSLLPLGEFRRDSEIENYLNDYSIRLKIGINYLKIKVENAKHLIELIDNELLR